MIFLKFIKILFTILLLLVVPIALYIATAFLLSFFSAKDKQNNTFNLTKKDKVYIIYDDVHSDLAFNLNSISEKWIKNLPILKNKDKGYIAFGWGDKETYLNTPTWNEIKVSTSLKALFINTPSVMHVTYYPNINYFIGVKAIKISTHQSNEIKASIFKSFDFKKEFYKGYGANDLFYNSPYKYNLIHTCNTWTGTLLRDANISMSYWTPFTTNIINSLE